MWAEFLSGIVFMLLFCPFSFWKTDFIRVFFICWKPKQLCLCLVRALRLGYPSSCCPLFSGLSLQVRVSLRAIVMVRLGRGLNRDKCQIKIICKIRVTHLFHCKSRVIRSSFGKSSDLITVRSTSFPWSFTITSQFLEIITITWSFASQFLSLKVVQEASIALTPSLMSYTPLSGSCLSIYALSLTCPPFTHSITSPFYHSVIKVDLIKRQEKKLIYICIQSIAIH